MTQRRGSTMRQHHDPTKTVRAASWNVAQRIQNVDVLPHDLQLIALQEVVWKSATVGLAQLQRVFPGWVVLSANVRLRSGATRALVLMAAAACGLVLVNQGTTGRLTWILGRLCALQVQLCVGAVYWSPSDSPTSLTPSEEAGAFLALCRGADVVMGDINARHPRWDATCQHPSPRGVTVVETLMELQGRVWPDHPTLSFFGPMGTSCVDLLLSFGATKATASLGSRAPGSDHLPLLADVETPARVLRSPIKRACIARSLADWGAFEREYQRLLVSIGPVGYQGAVAALARASKTLPRGIPRCNSSTITADKMAAARTQTDCWRFAERKLSTFGGNPLRVGEGWITSDRQRGKAFSRYFASLACPDSQRLARAAASLDALLAKEHGSVPNITVWEARQVLKTMGRTAPGADRILPEMLSDGPLEVMVAAMNDSLRGGLIPQQWCDVAVIPAAKRDKDPTIVANHRPLGVSSVVYRILDGVITWRIVRSGVIRLSPGQYAYQQNVTVEDAIFALHASISHRMCESCRREGRGPDDRGNISAVTLLLTADMKDAFASYVHDEMLAKLLLAGVPAAYVRLWREVHRRRSFRVRVGNYLSPPYACPLGETQGDVSAPLKWCVVVDELLRRIAAVRFPGQSTIGREALHRTVTAVGVADDIFVAVSAIGPTAVDMYATVQAKAQSVCDDIAAWSTESGIHFAKKTRLDVFTRHNWSTSGRISAPLPQVVLAGEIVEGRNSEESPPRVLGVLFGHDGGFLQHVLRLEKELHNVALDISAVDLPPISKRVLAWAWGVSKLRYAAATWGPYALRHESARLSQAWGVVARAACACLRVTSGEDAILDSGLPSVASVLQRACTAMWLRAYNDRAPMCWTSKLSSLEDNAFVVGRREWRGRVDYPTQQLFFQMPLTKSQAPTFLLLSTVLKSTEDRRRFNAQQIVNASAIAERIAGVRRVILIGTDGGVASGKSRAVAAQWLGSAKEAAAIIPDSGAGVHTSPIAVVDCGSAACSYRAESVAIDAALSWVEAQCEEQGPAVVIVVTDGLGALSHLDKGPKAARGTLQTWQRIWNLSANGSSIVLTFVYAHVGTAINVSTDARVCLAYQDTPAVAYPEAQQDVARLLDDTPALCGSERRKLAAAGTPGGGCLPDRLLRRLPYNRQAFVLQVRSGRLPLVGRLHGGLPAVPCPKCGAEETCDHFLACAVVPPARLSAFFSLELPEIDRAFAAWKLRADRWWRAAH